jgi:hypothetical protein
MRMTLDILSSIGSLTLNNLEELDTINREILRRLESKTMLTLMETIVNLVKEWSNHIKECHSCEVWSQPMTTKSTTQPCETGRRIVRDLLEVMH